MISKSVKLKFNKNIGKHPWVFSGAINNVSENLNDGEQVAVYSFNNQFIGWGLYNSKSQIRIRMYSWVVEEEINKSLWFRKIQEAVYLRKNILNLYDTNSACRLIFSEADGLSGLIVDKYSDYLIIQITSLAIYKHLEIIKQILIELCNPKGIYIRTEKGILQEEGLQLTDRLLCGNIPESPIQIIENDIKYEIDIIKGQKTGFYIDQRNNRKAIQKYVEKKTILDLCCYSGGFSLNAAKMNAERVVGVDISDTAIQIARRNQKINKLDNITFEKYDAFDFLKDKYEKKEKFDVIILDPPKFSNSKQSVKNASNGYINLNKYAISCLNKNGILVTCSCSGRISREFFFSIIQTACNQTNKTLQLLESRGQALDHPVSVYCEESNYLKCLIYRLVEY